MLENNNIPLKEGEVPPANIHYIVINPGINSLVTFLASVPFAVLIIKELINYI